MFADATCITNYLILPWSLLDQQKMYCLVCLAIVTDFHCLALTKYRAAVCVGCQVFLPKGEHADIRTTYTPSDSSTTIAYTVHLQDEQLLL